MQRHGNPNQPRPSRPTHSPPPLRAALDYLANRGYDPAFGARPVKRVVQQELETALAKGILRGEFAEEDTIVVEAAQNGEGLVVYRRGDPAARVEEAPRDVELTP